MAFDINWSLLTDASANLGNALANTGKQIGERRREARTNNALADAMADPKNVEAQDRLRRIDPRLAFQTEQLQRQKIAQLRADQQAELGFAARAFDGVQNEAGYRNAVANIRRAGFDVSDYPAAYDPAQISSIVNLGRMLNPVDPVKVGQGDVLINPVTGKVVARGEPKPQRYYPVAPGGTLVPEPTSGTSQQPVSISTDAEYLNLPNGTPFMGPDGVVRVKQ
ncbi:hypothetical protein [Rhizorhabdus wittichii]|uniref:hypothetical protein n=1 Tax=Rhizorhabdus wittichii TaxID=160791 RepID=UPI000367C3A0|nr:hypothetical protein [Rhizorhabdus wittichii]